MRRQLAETKLAEWLAYSMAGWVDPETRMPGISQHQLARLSGVSQAQVHEILKRGHTPKPDTLDQLAKFFGVSALYLYRLAYQPDGLPGDVMEKLGQLEEILGQLPTVIAERFLQQQIERAKLYLAEEELP